MDRHRRRGKAVQDGTIKPTLTAPGTKRLTLKCDILLSTSAFKFNSRRYTVVTNRTFAVEDIIASAVGIHV